MRLVWLCWLRRGGSTDAMPRLRAARRSESVPSDFAHRTAPSVLIPAAVGTEPSAVIAGLDTASRFTRLAAHNAAQLEQARVAVQPIRLNEPVFFPMDARVKPAHDESRTTAAGIRGASENGRWHPAARHRYTCRAPRLRALHRSAGISLSASPSRRPEGFAHRSQCRWTPGDVLSGK